MPVGCREVGNGRMLKIGEQMEDAESVEESQLTFNNESLYVEDDIYFDRPHKSSIVPFETTGYFLVNGLILGSRTFSPFDTFSLVKYKNCLYKKRSHNILIFSFIKTVREIK